MLTKQEAHFSKPRTSDQLNNKFEMLLPLFLLSVGLQVAEVCLCWNLTQKVLVMMQEL